MRQPGLLAAALLLLAVSARAGEEPPAPVPAPAPDAAKPAADRALPLHPGGIAWEKDLASARAESAKDGRPVALYFTFDT